MNLEEQLQQIVAPLSGKFGYCVRHLTTKEEIGMLLDEPLPMASVCKVPILVSCFRAHEEGMLDLSERVTFEEHDRCFGSGLFNAFDCGLNPTIKDLMLMMIVVSDNAATDMLLDRVPPDKVTTCMRDLGLNTISVDNKLGDLIGKMYANLDPRLSCLKYGEWDELMKRHPDLNEIASDLDRSRQAVNAACDGCDHASPRDMARLMAMIAEESCCCNDSCQEILKILGYQALNTRLPRFLPVGSKILHKTGTFGSGAVVNDAGVLYKNGIPIATIACLSRDMRNPIYETEEIIGKIARAVLDYCC